MALPVASSPHISITLTAYQCLPYGSLHTILQDITMLKLHPKAVLTASLLAGHGLRKGSLSLSGSAAALLVG